MTAQNKTTDLRSKAVARMDVDIGKAARSADYAPACGPPVPQQLLHELQVRQLKLEIQNEELQEANERLVEAKQDVETGLARYTALYELAPLPYFTLNRAGHIVGHNRVAAELMGKSMAGRAEPRFAARVASGSLPIFHEFLASVFEAPGKQRCEVWIEPVRGENTLLVELTGMAEPDGNVCNLTVVDMTERHEAKEEIQRLNHMLELRLVQLTATNKELEAFSYSVAHDLRTPLTAIDGFRTMLEMALQENNSEMVQHCSRRIRAGIEQMGLLTDGLLGLARVSRSDMRWEPVNLSEHAADVLKALQENEPARTVKLQIARDVWVNGDPLLLRQVLVNLLGNAWKFTSLKDQAEIAFGVQLRGTEGPAYFVRDNGAGFDMSFATRLFSSFERLHSQTEFPGTGVGLATVKRIVTRHHGKIRAEAKVNEGATFSFTLGAAQP